MTHDKGFAPNVGYSICSLSGCKKTTIEKWAKTGSWVIGIGGNNTGQPDKLIYVMKVDENLKYGQFKERYPRKSKYLEHKDAGTNVLLCKKEFYYFGKKAKPVPKKLSHIIIKRQGCKCVSDDDVRMLIKYLAKKDKYGIRGTPNDPKSHKKCRKTCD